VSDTPAIRRMRAGDADRVAVLAGELGYPSSAVEVGERMRHLLGRDDVAALVAEDAGRVIAWLHVEMRRSLVADHEAQVMALVVDEACRSRGIGAAMMAAAEGWAREQGAERLRVGSRVSRAEAHRFYERLGYDRSKTSHWFQKRLTPPSR
jgi:GNAT superfamily N-acetyltransferase